MSSIPLSDSGGAGGLMFMPQQGVPIKDPVIREHLRRQVMQDVGRYRWKAGLNRRKQVLQYPLHVILPVSLHHKTGNEDHASLSHKRLLPDALPESCCDSVSGKALDFERISFDRLGAGPLDPFAKYPFELDDPAQNLIHTGRLPSVPRIF